MYTKLTKAELKIIERTKKEGEEFYGKDGYGLPEGNPYTDADKNTGGSIEKPVPAKKPSKIKPYIFFIIIFILLAFCAKLMISLLN